VKVALVAGGCGFVGSHLCEYLLEKNKSRLRIEQPGHRQAVNVEHLLHNPNFSWLEHDINQSPFHERSLR